MRTKLLVIGVGLTSLLLTALPAAAVTLFSEDWQSSNTGSPYCTFNLGTSWSCSSVGATEIMGVLTDLSNKYLEISADTVTTTTAPHMSHSFTEPSGNYTAQVNFDNGGNSNNGDFAIMELTDSSNNPILDIGFRNANNYMDITDNAQQSKWRETSFTPPGAPTWYTYKVTVDPVGGRYDLVVSHGGSTDFTAYGVQWLSASNGKATQILLGSLSTNDLATGTYDNILVQN